VKKKDLERFRKLLASERNRILQNAIHMADRNVTIDADDVPDIVDLATSDLSLNLNVEIRERERHLSTTRGLAKIDDGSVSVTIAARIAPGESRRGSHASIMQGRRGRAGEAQRDPTRAGGSPLPSQTRRERQLRADIRSQFRVPRR
jgi:hypothetical protein